MYEDILQTLAYVILGIFIFFIGKLLKDLITPFDDDKELTTNDNPALGLSVAGYYLGVIIVYLGAAIGPSLAIGAYETNAEFYAALGMQLLITGGWSVAGVILLNIARAILDKVILKGFSIESEIITDRNMGAGAIEFGNYIASALIVAACIYGDSGNILTALSFFVIGQISLLLFTVLYQALTPFNIHNEIERDNNAAGVALCGNYIAMGLVVAAAASVPFEGWADSLIAYGISLFIGAALVIAGRFIADKLLLPGSSLNKEIATDQNVGAGLVECAAVISFGALVFAMI